jgi:hypothetical protein
LNIRRLQGNFFYGENTDDIGRNGVKLVLVSTNVLWDDRARAPHSQIQDALKAIVAQGHAVCLISSHNEPVWLKKYFSFVQFQTCSFQCRQSGQIVQSILDANTKNSLKHSDVIVLGASNADLFMAANSQTLLARCNWVHLEDRIRNYGLPVREPKGISKLIEFLRDRDPWYFHWQASDTEVFSLTNAGTIGELDAGIVRLNVKLKGCLKEGKIQNRKEFIAHLLSSLYATDTVRSIDVWGWYPSSVAGNENNEVMREFCTLARTMFGRRTKGPLFVRHKTASARHRQKGDRTDPSEQIQTVHINPAYKGLIEGKTIGVLDDYLTHGLSFGVASSLLFKAGAKKVVGITMGKFGHCAQVWDIQIHDDAYAPIRNFRDSGYYEMRGKTSSAAQAGFAKKFQHLM